MTIPDHISPIVAYRVWQWDSLGLKSLNNEQWFPGSALEANASRCGKGHVAPTDGCTCGVYAARDLSTPSGRLMFQIIGAMAEFERSLIQERVKAGLRNAKLKGKALGRPRRIVDGDRIAKLREQGASFRQIARAVGASPGTVRTRLRGRLGRPEPRLPQQVRGGTAWRLSHTNSCFTAPARR